MGTKLYAIMKNDKVKGFFAFEDLSVNIYDP